MTEQTIFRLRRKTGSLLIGAMSAGKGQTVPKSWSGHWKRPRTNSRATHWCRLHWWSILNIGQPSDVHSFRGSMERWLAELGRSGPSASFEYALGCVTHAAILEIRNTVKTPESEYQTSQSAEHSLKMFSQVCRPTLSRNPVVIRLERRPPSSTSKVIAFNRTAKYWATTRVTCALMTRSVSMNNARFLTVRTGLDGL